MYREEKERQKAEREAERARVRAEREAERARKAEEREEEKRKREREREEQRLAREAAKAARDVEKAEQAAEKKATEVAAAVAEAAAVEKRKKEAAATKHILRRRQLKAKQSLKRASQVTIARYFRGWACRQHFVDMQHAAQLLQAATRRHSAFKFVKILRFQVKKKKQSIAIATLLLQTQRRMLHTSITTWKVHTNQFLLEKQAAISIQTSWRRSALPCRQTRCSGGPSFPCPPGRRIMRDGVPETTV